jgi:hypothetical protein
LANGAGFVLRGIVRPAGVFSLACVKYGNVFALGADC